MRLLASVFAKVFSRRDARPCVPTSTYTKRPIFCLKIGRPKQLRKSEGDSSKPNRTFMQARLLYFTILFFIASGYLSGQTPTFIHYEPEIDLPFSTTYGDIVQDSLGYIWFGTDSGLYRYDGEGFERIPIASEIKDIEILNLKKDHEGTLWFTTLTGKLCYYTKVQDSIKAFNPNSFFDTLLVQNFKLQKNRLLVLSKNRNKDLFFVQEFESFKSKATTIHTIAHSCFSISFCLNQQDFILDKSSNVKITQYLSPFSRRNIDLQALSHFIYNNDKTFLSFNDKEISFLTTKNKQRIKIPFPPSTIINNWYLKDSIVWFLTKNGSLKMNLNTHKLEQQNQLKDQDIFSMLEDREGGYWIGTNGNGIFYFPPLLLSNYPNHRLLSSSRIQKIQKIKNGLYVVAAGNSLQLLTPQSLTPGFRVNLNTRIRDFFIDGQSIYLTTASNYALKYYYNNTTNSLKFVKKLPFFGKFFIPLPNKNYLSGGYLFLKLYDSKTHSFKSLTSTRVTSLFKDTSSSSIWIGGIDGIQKWEYSEDKTFHQPEKISGIKSHITMISMSPDHHIWLSTASDGLFEYFNDTIQHYPFFIENKKKKIDRIDCNDPEKVWFTSFNTVYYFDKVTKKFIQPHRISTAIKFPIVSFWNNNDTLFLGTKKGLYLYFPSTTNEKTINPLIKVESVSINNKDTLIFPSYTLSNSQNNIEVKFQSIGAFDPFNKPLIFYKLKEKDDWHFAKDGQILFSNLSPGDYQLVAKSVNDKRQSDYNTANIHFIIKKPFWQTLWFTVLVASSSVMILFLWFRYKKKQIILKKSQEQESEKLKSAVLQLQMNPHFIFNSMNTIIYYITVANKEKSIQILTKMSRLIRQIFNFSNKSLISLSTELSFLSDYLDMEQERFSEKVKIISQIDPQALDSSFPIPPLMVQPILENSFKHGLFHKKSGGILHFTVQIKDRQVIFIVEDNGVGRKEKKSTDKKMSSYDVIENRIKLINESQGEFANISAQFFIEDLFDTHQNPKGTKSTLIFELDQQP